MSNQIIGFPPLAGDGSVSTGGSDTYTSATPVPTTIGGITSGSTFTAQTMKQMWDSLLYPYQLPAFTAFSISGFGTKEVGDSFTAGSNTFNWSTSNSTNVTANTIKIEDVTNGTTLIDLGANDGSEVIATPQYLKTTASTHNWRISAKNTNNVSFNRTFSVSWMFRAWYGESANASLTSADVKLLRASSLKTTANGDYAMLAGGYKLWAFPMSFGLKTVWKDIDTGFDVAMTSSPEVVSITNDFGITVDYHVYRTYNVLGGNINVRIS